MEHLFDILIDSLHVTFLSRVTFLEKLTKSALNLHSGVKTKQLELNIIESSQYIEKL